MQKLGAKTAVVSAGAVIGAIVAIVTGWPVVGWETPNSHAADISRAEKDILDAIGELDRRQQERHEQWLCDETDEDLRDLLAEREAEGPGADLDEDIRQLREKLDKLNCERFN